MFGIQNGHKHFYIKFSLHHVDIFGLLIVKMYQLVAANTCSHSTCFQIAMNCYHNLQHSVTLSRGRFDHVPKESFDGHIAHGLPEEQLLQTLSAQAADRGQQ